jgi:hypothetical protein
VLSEFIDAYVASEFWGGFCVDLSCFLLVLAGLDDGIVGDRRWNEGTFVEMSSHSAEENHLFNFVCYSICNQEALITTRALIG